MTARATPQVGRGPAPAATTPAERLRGGLLWLTGLSGAFVFIEPSPYEVVSLATILVFAVTGLALRPAIMPLVLVLILYNIGFSIAVIPILGQSKAVTWVLISWYMAGTAVFFAAMTGENTAQRVSLVVRGYTAAALVASLAGILGYFHAIPGITGAFLKFGRAQGTFNDPNVFGAFLVFPALIALQRVLSGRLREMLRGGALLLIFVLALLLSFSRAAWGQFAFCSVLLMGLTFVTSRSPSERLRVVTLAAAGLVALAAFLAVLLSIGTIGELFQQRASLEQSYDSGHTGRFGRHLLGFLLALDTPWGIGPLQFANIFPEDPHNSYLNAFMSGGWISGLCYITLVIVTLCTGFRFVFVATPWRPVYLAIFVAVVGIAGESAIVDSDHWRHYFLLLGLLWGLIAASLRYAGPRAAAARAPRAVSAPLAHAGPAA
ncbi:MAG: O-antigen ligase family protein [Variibacter sp.]|nr:O-antigen ligase family protein [Variibacter sp.]